ncbi:MAG: alkaline phosphatase PhoX [Cyanobacteriota bacterium]|nr:alkaline phosphatase PhoX [Cyanobacteriota bacterium]
MSNAAALSRRRLLQLLGLGSATSAAAFAGGAGKAAQMGAGTPAALGFKPLRPPLPLPGDGLSAKQQQQHYRQLTLDDRLLVPEGYRADVLAVWGDRLADGRFGFNNDYLALLPLATAAGVERALLSVNFEYISPRTWAEGYREAVGEPLPLAALQQELAPRGGSIDASTLAADDPLRAQIEIVARAAMADLGIGVLELERGNAGWRRLRGSSYERRIDGLTPVACSGPAAAVFRQDEPLGYRDGLGERIIGTFANCAGGTTPWGTVLSAEENFQSQVAEAVFADGSASDPGARPFRWNGSRLDGLGNPFALAGNKYGWMIEFDPRQPGLPAVKHSLLGRFRHEAVAVVAKAGKPLVVYSGCDRHGGHLYRFVSAGVVRDPSDRANSRLFEAGRLEVARFEPDGTGTWIALDAATPVNPQSPSHYERYGWQQPTLLPHSDRRRSGSEAMARDAALDAYRQRYRVLGDLYPRIGTDQEAAHRQQGAILIDAHLAANAAGATACPRPEDTDIDPTNGDLLIAFTSAGRDDAGSSDPAIFRGPKGQPLWPHGWVMRLSDGGTGRGERFSWRMVALGGVPWAGGLGFSHPDNLAFDPSGNLWLTTDRSSDASLDVFGNNSCWVLPRKGNQRGQALCFAIGPVDCELCGPCFDTEGRTLFLAVQHPGESGGTRLGQAVEAQAHQLVDRSGQRFEQLRWVPLGSNWPSGVPGRPALPGVVAISRRDGNPLLGAGLSASPRA